TQLLTCSLAYLLTCSYLRIPNPSEFKTMEILVLSVLAFSIALLTFFSGFGLGTLLTPVFMMYFPVEIAIGLTGVVHFFNNVFKLFLVGRQADRTVLLRFGLPAILAALLGSWLLFLIPNQHALFMYEIGTKTFSVTPVKFMVALLLLVFASIEVIPYFKKLQFDKSKLPIGGFLSGFFGGLSGNQGALRSAFLLRAGLTKEAFIGSTVVVSTFVDCTRLGIYAVNFQNAGLSENLTLLITVTASGILGSYIGNRLLKKVTLPALQTGVALLLFVLALALGLGLV
ncbi:MAG TPA: sulfite exporter TauE/SafE family protein, partial [Flavobacterium sp.]|nr:sulfite exporter TauE/SafE family protein [Flavobacterium sp.]